MARARLQRRSRATRPAAWPCPRGAAGRPSPAARRRCGDRWGARRRRRGCRARASGGRCSCRRGRPPPRSGSRAPAPSRAAGSAAAAGAGTPARRPAAAAPSRKRATSAASSASVGASAKAGWVTSTTGSSISSLAPTPLWPDWAKVPEGVRHAGLLVLFLSDAHSGSIHTNARGVCRSAYNDERCEPGRSLSSPRRACSRRGACASARTTCPLGTALARQVYSGGAEAEWCRRPDGARQGPETRFYESGAELASGGYVDGAQSGVWRYRFNDGRNWRAERWDDGALVADDGRSRRSRRMSPGELEALGPTSSGIIKLASHDPIPGRRDARGGRRRDVRRRGSPTGARASPGATTPTGCASASGGSGSRTGVRRARSNTWTACASAPRASGTRTATPAADGRLRRRAGARDAGGSGTSAASSPADVVYRRWRARLGAPSGGGMLPHEP